MNAVLDRAKMAKLLGMLGSEHDGEVVSAARQAERLRRTAGVSWQDIILPALPPPDDNQDDDLEFVLRHSEWLNNWERQFALSLARQHRPPSEKQRAILFELVEKCRAAARTAA